MAEFQKINDLSQFALRKKFVEQEFKPETNLSVAMGRVSVKKNKDAGNSDVAQLETIGDYAEKNGLSVVRIWDVAETASKHDKRKHFLEMIDFVKASQDTSRPIKHVLFSHQSRSNRNRESAREIEVLVRSMGVTLHCARDHLKLTSQSTLEDWMRWDLFNNLNEKFIKDHTRNVMDGTFKRVEMGLFPGKAPFGYRNFRASERDTSIFQLVEPAAAYMRMAFELFSTGRYTEKTLKRELDQRFPQLEKRPAAKRFYELLRNPFYYGEFNYGGQRHRGNPTYHPPLIGRDLWDQVQAVIDSPTRSFQKVTKKEHPYLGLLRCGGVLLDKAGNITDQPCNSAVTAEEKRKRLADGSTKVFHYYHCARTTGRCSQRDRGYMAAIGRKRVNFSETEIEELFETIVKPLSFPPEVAKWMQEVLIEQHREKSKDHESHVSSLQFQYRALDRKIDTAYNDRINGTIDEVLWKAAHDRLAGEKARVERQLRAISGSKDEYIQRGVLLIELVQHTERTYKKATPEVKRRIIEIVSSNQVLRDGRVEFNYRKPFDLLAEGSSKSKWWSQQESNLQQSFRKAPLYPFNYGTASG